MENTEVKNRDIHLKEVFYVFCKNILLEILLFVLILGIGFGFAYNSKPYYVASANIIIKANLSSENTENNYNDSSLARMYVIPMCDVLKTNAFIERVNNTLKDAEGMKTKTINSGNFTIKNNDESLVIALSYRDDDKNDAEKKLDTIIATIEEFSSEMEEENSKYFAAVVRAVAIRTSEGKAVSNVATQSDKVKILIISAVIGLVAVACLVFSLLIFADKVSSVTKLESLTGKKNFITIEKKRFKKKGERDKDNPNAVNPEFLRFKVNKLSDTLIYLKDGEKNKVYQMQSATSGEGKTTVAINLAINLGQDERKTLIIDCDFSHPTAHHAFKLSKKVGITDFFKGELDFDGIVKHTSFKNVDLITCGDHIYDHTIFFTSAKFKAILDNARERYDIVLLDCAPVKALSDYINISPLVDGTLLVVQSDRISAREVKYVVDELNSCNANLMGTVLNFTTTTQNKQYYYYYHKNYHESASEEVTTISQIMDEANN